jgi:hypothetical protein
MTKDEFISQNGIRKVGLIEYIKDLENQGFNKRQIQAKLIENNIVKSIYMLPIDYKFYDRVKDEINWV